MKTSSRCLKSNDGNVNTVLPPKPYTEYTIFFRLERTRILQTAGIIDEEVLPSLDPTHYDSVEFPRPSKYERLLLPPYWYSSSRKAEIEKKRKHRKRAGRMDLMTLSKTISARWRDVDPAVLEYCKKLAKSELEKYSKAIEGIMRDKGDKARDVGKKQDQQPKEMSQSQVSVRGGTMSLQEMPLTPAKRVDTTGMPITGAPVSANFNGLSQAKLDAVMVMPVASATATVSAKFNSDQVNKSMPATNAPVNANFNCLTLSERLRVSYSEAMGYNSPPIENHEQSVLQMIQLQAAQQPAQAAYLNMKLQLAECNSSPNSLNSSSSPFHSGIASVSPENKPQKNQQQQQATQLNANLKLGRHNSSPNLFKSSSQIFGDDNPAARPEDMPERKNKRKFIRRHVSAPPVFMGSGAIVSGAGGNKDTVFNSNNRSASLGEDEGKPENQTKRPLKRRSTMTSDASCELVALKEILSTQYRREPEVMPGATVPSRDGNSELSNSFQKELKSTMLFTWIPEWDRKDADTLLDILS